MQLRFSNALPFHRCCCCSCSDRAVARTGTGLTRITKLGMIGFGAMLSAGLTVTATLSSICASPLYTPRVEALRAVAAGTPPRQPPGRQRYDTAPIGTVDELATEYSVPTSDPP